MPETTTPTQTVPAVVTRTVVVNGKPLNFKQGILQKGDDKGAPVLVFSYKSGDAPDIAEFAEIAAVLGQAPIMKSVGKLLRNITKDASISAAVKNPDGSYSLDPGVFAAKLQAEVADLVTAAKEQLLEELAKVDNELNTLVAAMLKSIGTGKIPSQEEQNRIMQLQLKRSGLVEKTKKKARTPKAKTADAKA